MSAIIGTILLIDDEETVHSLARYHLERAGFSVLSAKDTQSALRTIDEQPGLLAVLLDIHLPRPDIGWALLGRLAKMKENKLAHTPIIVYSVNDDKHRARTAGADEHFVKPVNHKDLVTVLETYAEQRSKAEDK
jgi:CheY-like chemotaxis protein